MVVIFRAPLSVSRATVFRPSQEVILSEGDVVYIPPGEKFYWEGNMTIVLPAAPAWNPEQHEVYSASKNLADSRS